MGSKEWVQRFPAVADSVMEVSTFVEPLAAEAGVPLKLQMQLDLIIEEVVLNICNYAYPEQGGDFSVRIEQNGGELVMLFEDQGVAFDPLQAEAPDVTLGLEERGIGGLGILLVRRLSDRVEYCRQGETNRLMVVFRLEEH